MGVSRAMARVPWLRSLTNHLFSRVIVGVFGLLKPQRSADPPFFPTSSVGGDNWFADEHGFHAFAPLRQRMSGMQADREVSARRCLV
jgi:hypothetical protein